MRPLARYVAAFFLLAVIAASAIGVLAACADRCDGVTCGICVDCLCCPNGTSTPGEPTGAIGRLASGELAGGGATPPLREGPSAEILHVPLRLPA